MIQIDIANVPSQEEQHQMALQEIALFLKNNPQIPMPKITRVDKMWAKGECSYPSKDRVCRIKLKKTLTPVTKTPGFAWSFPGYKADMTQIGVLAHEFGHAVHFALMDRTLWKTFQEMTKGESNVTSYEPNHDEKFAEAFKLFLTNPDFLKVGRPMRYKFLTEVLGLVPNHNEPWTKVLSGSHPKLQNAAANWIKA